MEKLKLPDKINCLKEKGNYALFEIKPLFPGYGVTIGNALRRVLLSSLPGGAIVAIKIKGTDHEFSTIDFIKEDLVSIILNIKKIRLKVYKDESVRMTLKVKGPKEVKAKDIKCPSNVEIANPDQLIATITDKKAILEMEFIVEKGRGYVPIAERPEKDREIGVMAIDAIYTPVERVSYNIEDMRVGKMTNYNRLLLEVETDGTITPREAVSQAASILVDHFNPFIKEVKEKLTERVSEKKEEIEKKGEELEITQLNLPERITNILLSANVKNVNQLLKFDAERLKDIPRIGDKAIADIKKALKKFNLEIKEGKEEGEKKE